MSVDSVASSCYPLVFRAAFKRIAKSPLANRLANGLFWSMAGVVCSRGLMLAAAVFVARILGKAGFGEFGIIKSTVGMLGVFAGFALGLIATKHVAEYRHSDPEFAGRIIGLSELIILVTGGLMTLGLFL